MTRFIQILRHVAVASLLVVALSFASGCDGSGAPEPEPSASFTASVTGDTTATLTGSAQMTQSSAAFPGGMMPDTSSYTWGVPTAPGEQLGTAIVLTTASGMEPVGAGSAQAIMLYLPGATDPSPGEYDLPNLLLAAEGGGFADPSMSMPFATYIETRGTGLRTAPAISGTITVGRVTSEGVFGSFRFDTRQALTLDFAQPLDSLNESSLEPEPFATTIDGTFEAVRVDLAQGMYPAMGWQP